MVAYAAAQLRQKVSVSAPAVLYVPELFPQLGLFGIVGGLLPYPREQAVEPGTVALSM